MSLLSWVPLGDLAELRAGIGFPTEMQGKAEGDYPFAKVGDISRCARSGGVYISSSDSYVDKDDVKSLRAKLVPEGSVLFAKIGEAIRQNYRVLAGCELLVDNNAMAAIANERILSKYLYHYLKTVDFYCLAPSTTVPAIRKSDLQKLLVPVLSMQEQKRVSKILDEAELLRDKRRAMNERLDELVQAIFIDMFGDPIRNEKGWPRTALKELLLDVESGNSPVCLDRPVCDSEWGVLKLGAISKCFYISGENKALPDNIVANKFLEVKAGDLLFSRKNTYALVAACAFVTETPARLLIPDLIFRLRIAEPAMVLPQYLHALLVFPTKRRTIQKLAGGSSGSMPNISKAKLRGVLIEVPPIDLQKQFVARINKVDDLRKTLSRSSAQLDTLFTSLQHRAFRGEL